jgi:hypothetical protein
MLMSDLDHLDRMSEPTKIRGGQVANDFLSLYLSGNGALSLKRGNQFLYNTVVPVPPSGLTITLEDVPSYTVTGTSTSPDGAVQSFFSSSGIGTQGSSTVSFTFSSLTLAYPRF